MIRICEKQIFESTSNIDEKNAGAMFIKNLNLNDTLLPGFGRQPGSVSHSFDPVKKAVAKQ